MLFATLLSSMLVASSSTTKFDPFAVANKCADDPALFAARELPMPEIEKILDIRSAGNVKVLSPSGSFEITGECVKYVRHLGDTISMKGGRLLHAEFEPSFNLVKMDGQVSWAAPPAPSFPMDVADVMIDRVQRKLSFKMMLGFTGKRQLGLWSSPKGSMIGVMNCNDRDMCSTPTPLIVTRYQIRDMFALPDPDSRPVSEIWLWIYVNNTKNASIALTLSNPYN